MNSRDHNTPKLKRKKYLPLLHQYALNFNGTDEYLTRALPTNLLTGNQNDFYPAGSRPTGWVEGSGETWNQVGITGSTTSMVLKLAGTSARAIYGGLTIGQKYKMRIRWYGDSALNIGSVAGSGDYFIIAATTQWNTVIVTFTAVSTSISFGIASGTGYIDFFNFTPDWKLDLNESWELIKHSNNRTFADTAIDWVGSGNHSAARSTVDKYEGVASLLISATSAGNSATNHVKLPAAQMESFVVGSKYTKEIWTKIDPTSLTWGSNLLTGDNSTFDSGIGSWLFGAGSFTASGGYGIMSAAGAQTYIYRTVTSANKFLKVILRAKSDTYVGRLRVYHNQGNAPYIAHTGNLTSSWQTFTLYANSWASAQTFYIQLESNHTGDVHIDDLSIQQADMLNITTQIGTKSITTSRMTVGVYSKSVLNFEASSTEVNQDIRLFLSGVGSVFVDSLSLTQKYDYTVVQIIKPVNNAVFKYSFGQASALFGGLNIYVTSGNELNIRSYDNYGTYIQSSAGSVSNNWQSVIVTKDHENQKLYLDNVLKDTGTISSLGKAAIGNFIVGWAIDGGGTRYLGLVGATQIIRFNNLSQSNFNPNTYEIGQTITGGGAEVVLWLDPKNGSSIANMLQDYSGNGNNLSAVNIDLTNRVIVRK